MGQPRWVAASGPVWPADLLQGLPWVRVSWRARNSRTTSSMARLVRAPCCLLPLRTKIRKNPATVTWAGPISASMIQAHGMTREAVGAGATTGRKLHAQRRLPGPANQYQGALRSALFFTDSPGIAQTPGIAPPAI